MEIKLNIDKLVPGGLNITLKGKTAKAVQKAIQKQLVKSINDIIVIEQPKQPIGYKSK